MSEKDKEKDKEKEKAKELRINEQIRTSSVRLIDDDGNQVGILSIIDALSMAASRHLDLVEVSPNVTPPVCRIMDYGKFKYQQSKKKQEAKKKQATIQIKEVKLRQKTEEHDIQTKLKKVIAFLSEGNRVKISIIFRGREITHTDRGEELMQRIISAAEEVGQIESGPMMEGRALVLLLSAKKS